MLSLAPVALFLSHLLAIKSQSLSCSYEPPTVYKFTGNKEIESKGFFYPTQSTNSPLILSVEREDTFGKSIVVFGCTHHAPVEWDVDISDPKRFEFKQSLSWQKTVGGVRRFFSAFQLKVNASRTQSTRTLFSCHTIPLETDCHQRLVILKTNGYPDVSPINLSHLDELKSTHSEPKFGNKSSDECDFILAYRPIQRNSLQYKWKTNVSSFETFAKKTIQPVYFQGMFRSVTQEPNCVELIPPEESCEDCKIIADGPNLPNLSGDGLAFYANSSDKEVLFKGIFGVNSTVDAPKFFWEWELRIEDMVHLNSTTKFYVNRTESVTCTVSTLYFAYGTIVRTSDEDVPLTLSDSADEVERYEPESMRKVTKTITFYDNNPNKSVSCFAPLRNYSKMIPKSVPVFVEIPVKPKLVSLQESDESNHVINLEDRNKSLTCQFEGNPLDEIKWTLPSEDLRTQIEIYNSVEKSNLKSTLVIPQINKKGFSGSYTCSAENYLGEDSKTFTLEFPSGLSKSVIIGLGLGLGFVTLICLVILGVLYLRIIKQRKEFQTKTTEAIREFREGLLQKRRQDKLLNQLDKFSKLEDLDAKTKHHVSIMEEPYNEAYEIPRDLWTIEEKLLGQGAFGYVREGFVKMQNKTVQCAVKMMKSAVDIEDFKNFLFELKIMAYIGHHPNIVSLVAACTQNIEQRDVMIGVEFCANGSLMDYLINKRSMFKRITNFGSANDAAMSSDPTDGTYANLVHCVGLTDQDLYVWSYQIASGMEFLSSKRVLHGDLATRNVLLTLDKTAKISDFGLSRVLADSSNYTKKSKVPLPWKWMALESLKTLTFSTGSDVWAYGVTLWEIFSLGEAPYAGLHFCPEFIQQVQQGLRLAKPSKSTDYIYGIMKRCWEEVPARRITFSQLKDTFTVLLEALNNPDGEIVLQPIPTPRRMDIGSSTTVNALGIDQLYSNVPRSRSSNLYLNV